MHLYQKHAPKNLAGFAGNPSTVDEVKKWALLIENGKRQKPLLVHGPPGIGKTALAYALAGEMGWEIIELNASDTRNKGAIERTMGAASSSAGLFSARKLILIDEVDGIHGNQDRGGVSAISKVLKESNQPVMLIANDAWDKRLSPLRSVCTFVEMRKVNKRTICSVISSIAGEEGIGISGERLEEIADNSDGDLRSAIIDITAAKVRSARDRNTAVFECVRGLFKAESFVDAQRSFGGSTLDHDMVKLWIEQNIKNEYEHAHEVACAYGWLSRADVFDGRIMRRQAWKLLKYSSTLMLTGVSMCKQAKYRKFVKYEFPGYLRRMGLSSEKRGLRKRLRLKVAQKCHVSLWDADMYFPLIRLMAKAGSAGYFELDDDELEFAQKV